MVGYSIFIEVVIARVSYPILVSVHLTWVGHVPAIVALIVHPISAKWNINPLKLVWNFGSNSAKQRKWFQNPKTGDVSFVFINTTQFFAISIQ